MAGCSAGAAGDETVLTFDKGRAHADVAVQGGTAADADFVGGSDRIRYVVDAARANNPITVDVVLRFQPIGFRWAENLREYAADEPRRFVRYFEAAAARSSEVIARATLKADGTIGRPERRRSRAECVRPRSPSVPASSKVYCRADAVPWAFGFTTVIVRLDGYCFEWCTALRATTPFASS